MAHTSKVLAARNLHDHRPPSFIHYEQGLAAVAVVYAREADLVGSF